MKHAASTIYVQCSRGTPNVSHVGKFFVEKDIVHTNTYPDTTYCSVYDDLIFDSSDEYNT